MAFSKQSLPYLLWSSKRYVLVINPSNYISLSYKHRHL